jgi:hypothetical protein
MPVEPEDRTRHVSRGRTRMGRLFFAAVPACSTSVGTATSCVYCADARCGLPTDLRRTRLESRRHEPAARFRIISKGAGMRCSWFVAGGSRRPLSGGGVRTAALPDGLLPRRDPNAYTDQSLGDKGAAVFPLQVIGWSGRHPHGRCETRRTRVGKRLLPSVHYPSSLADGQSRSSSPRSAARQALRAPCPLSELYS